MKNKLVGLETHGKGEGMRVEMGGTHTKTHRNKIP